MKGPFRRHVDRIALGAIVLVYLALAVSYSVVNPLYESTDEVRHYHYVRHLLAYHTLPVQDPTLPRAQSHHPPLYYALAALASSWVTPDHPLYFDLPVNPYWGYRYWEVSVDNKNQYMHGADEAFPYQGDALAAHIARWVNVLIGLGTVLVTYRLGRVVFPDQPWLAVGGTAFVAFNPMFLYMSGAVNNDVAAALTGSAVILASAEAIANGVTLRRALILGALYGLALMAKFNLAFIFLLIELALLADAWNRRTARELVRANLAVIGVAAVIAGWWFVRNQVLYGEPTGFQRMTVLWGSRDPRTSLPLAISELPYAWTSFWGRFGYGQLPMPDWAYNGLKIVGGLSLVGLGVRLAQLWRARSTSRRLGLLLGLLIASVLGFAGVLFGYMLVSPAGAMGRFTFPALAAFGVCMFYGLSAWAPARWGHWLAVVCVAGMAGLSLYALTGIVAPAYTRPAQLSEGQIASIQHPVQAVLDNRVRLLGYDVNTLQLQPGGEFVLTVYWQVLAPSAPDLTVFVQLLSRDGPIIAQRDTYPGLGRFPASSWQPGDTFSDRYRIVLDDYTYAPDVADVLVGMYIPNGGRLPVTDPAGNSLGTAITLTQAIIAAPPESVYPNPIHLNFDNKATLVGYDLSARRVQAGQPLTLTLYWQASQAMQYDYSVFAHVLGEAYQTWATNDGFPYTSPENTSRWTVGQVYKDVRVLRLAPDTPPGMYPIEMGLFGEPVVRRLPILAADGHHISDRILLIQIRVEPP